MEPDKTIDLQARGVALELLDEAIRAQREERVNGALSALDRARRTDPLLPGVDVSFAALALGEKQFGEMRTAAMAAKAKNDHAAAASVLLGMDKWIARGPSARETSSASNAASAHFAEAAKMDYFHAQVWFFWGDILRRAGREAEGKEYALAALHRFDPWDSSDVLAAKIVFTSAEAGMPTFFGLGIDEDSPWVRVVANSIRAREFGKMDPLAPLLSYSTQRSIGALSNHPIATAASRD